MGSWIQHGTLGIPVSVP